MQQLDATHVEGNAKIRADLREIYEYAVKENIRYYRGVAGSGAKFGYNEDTNEFFKLSNYEWAENPHYKAPVDAKENEKLEADTNDDVAHMLVDAEVQVKPQEPVTNYKAMYDEAQAQIEFLKAQNEREKQELVEKANQAITEAETARLQLAKIVDAIRLIKSL